MKRAPSPRPFALRPAVPRDRDPGPPGDRPAPAPAAPTQARPATGDHRHRGGRPRPGGARRLYGSPAGDGHAGRYPCPHRPDGDAVHIRPGPDRELDLRIVAQHLRRLCRSGRLRSGRGLAGPTPRGAMAPGAVVDRPGGPGPRVILDRDHPSALAARFRPLNRSARPRPGRDRAPFMRRADRAGASASGRCITSPHIFPAARSHSVNLSRVSESTGA
jgi:hypothetical protein